MTCALAEVVNIGPRLAAGLRGIGIDDLEELRREGAMPVWERLRRVDSFDCVHSLLALEGAIQGVRWHLLPVERRTELADFARRRNS
ncbi:TfoX/Sxy family DNA transformation protein [Luethyella okanaganae]|uniref:TfoX/Sxy family DNA transformation protein n=1 Tax=Luethyella okanaganae TaxID=69372 RepID=A0ABW1VHY8_9MICO